MKLDLHNIIKRPLVTEKASVGNATGTYVFEVNTQAKKSEIAQALNSLFDVQVRSVRVVNGRGRKKVTRAGVSLPKYYKKAYVSLKDGQTIALFEGGV